MRKMGSSSCALLHTEVCKSCTISTLHRIQMLPDWRVSDYIVFMYYIRILVVLPCMPTCDVLLHHFRKCCHTCADTRLRTLISYVLLVYCNARFSV